jgi:hypothetical protein
MLIEELVPKVSPVNTDCGSPTMKKIYPYYTLYTSVVILNDISYIVEATYKPETGKLIKYSAHEHDFPYSCSEWFVHQLFAKNLKNADGKTTLYAYEKATKAEIPKVIKAKRLKRSKRLKQRIQRNYRR